MGLYIDAYTIFESSYLSCEHVPSVVDMQIPGYSGMLRGLLTSDTTISLKNTFGAALPDVETLQAAAQLVNWSSVPAWIGASTQVWRGTDAVRFPLEFYLINYKPGLKLEEGLKQLAKLATMMRGEEGPLSSVFAKVHGGYTPDVLANNNQQFLPNKLDPKKDELRTTEDGTKRSGVIEIRIGTNFTLGNLILTKIDISRSNVEVRSPKSGTPKPLYYRVQCQLQTCRAALETDVDSMFGGI